MADSLPRVLLVDDESDIVNVLKQGLKLKGFKVDAFTDPARALIEFKPDFYDFLITDIRMPEINGFELYRKIREIDRKIKVYFLTAFDIYEKEAESMFPSLNAKRFIKKPIRYQDLAQTLLEDHAQ